MGWSPPFFSLPSAWMPDMCPHGTARTPWPGPGWPLLDGLSPFTATSSSLRPGPTSPSTSQRSRRPCASCCPDSRSNNRPVKRPDKRPVIRSHETTMARRARGTGVPQGTTRARHPVLRPRGGGAWTHSDATIAVELPTQDTTRKGDFGELIAACLFSHRLGHEVPFQKLAGFSAWLSPGGPPGARRAHSRRNHDPKAHPPSPRARCAALLASPPIGCAPFCR